MSVYDEFTFYSDNGEVTGMSFVRADRDEDKKTMFFWNPSGEFKVNEYDFYGSPIGADLYYDTQSGMYKSISFYDPFFITEATSFTLTGGDDIETFGNTDDFIAAGDGDDIINAGGGHNVLLGGNGNDHLTTIAQTDLIFGGADNDFVQGGSRNDYLAGGDGNDEVRGQKGNDVISGDGGNDLIDGGPGDDIIFDLYGHNKVYGKDGDDFIILGAGNDTVSGGSGDDIIEDSGTVDEGFNRIHGDDGNDHITATSGSNRLYGDAGNDVLGSGNGGDHLKGGDGDDIMNGGGGADELYGEAGNDTLYADGSNVEDIGEDKLRGGDGNDRLIGGNGTDTLYGDAGDDLLVGTAQGKAIMTGGEGSDTFAFMGFHSPMHYIKDFGADDFINVSDMLDGYDRLTDDINNFVQFNHRDDTRTDIRINVDGEGTGFTSLVGIFANLTGVTVSDMLNSGQLIADQKLFGSDF